MPIFSLPAALWGLAALPVLAGIYLLRNRSRRQVVSSLMLWSDITRSSEGGRHLRRLQVPLLMILELLILALLVMAAADPKVLTSGGRRPVVVVLDDSISMLAGGVDSPRSRGLAGIERDLRDGGDAAMWFVLAAAEPRLLGGPATTPAQARDLLAGWTCNAGRADLAGAVGLASAVAGTRAGILVVTDHPGQTDPGEGRIVWRATGRVEDNFALINAVRTRHEGRDRCLIEVANFSDRARTARVELECGRHLAGRPTRLIELAAGRKKTIQLDLPAGSAPLHVRLPHDSLAADNEVTLLSGSIEPLRVETRFTDEKLREAVERAVTASGIARLTPRAPHLLLTDQGGAKAAMPSTWPVRLIAADDAEAFVGPFVQDRAHPLCRGVGLRGVVWAAARKKPLGGTVVIAAGNTPLVTDSHTGIDRHDLRINFQPKLSTLHTSTSWPVLFWNLLTWRGGVRPGVASANVRLGEPVTVVAAEGISSLKVHPPGGEVREVPVRARRAAVTADRPGVYRIEAGAATYTFAANVLHPGESDLSGAASGQWGRWIDDASSRQRHRPVAWVLLMAALAGMACHSVLARRVRP